MINARTWHLVPLLAPAGAATAVAVGCGLVGAWPVAAWAGFAALAGVSAWIAAIHAAPGIETAVALVVDPAVLAVRRATLYDELCRLEEGQDLQNGVFEVGAELVGCVDEADALQRFAAAMRRYWGFAALELWVWERGSWRGIGAPAGGSPPIPERPVQLPSEAGGDLILDLSTAVSGQAVLVLRGATDQPSLVGRSDGDQRWVAEVLRSQLALSLRRVLLYAELNALARMDPLTGTHRRWYGETRLAELVESGQVVSVAMVDIDHFKRINDEFGHAAGDQVLGAVGQALTHCLRMGDLVCRFGGEEFLVILPDTPPAGALHVAGRLRSAVAELTGLPRHMTVSVGVASCHQDETAPNLVARADTALYDAKHAGRDQVMVAGDPDDPRLRIVARKVRRPGESSSQRKSVKDEGTGRQNA